MTALLEAKERAKTRHVIEFRGKPAMRVNYAFPKAAARAQSRWRQRQVTPQTNRTEADWDEIERDLSEKAKRTLAYDMKWKWLGIGIALTVVIASLVGLTH